MSEQEDLELMHALAFFYWRRNQNERAAPLAYAAYRLGNQDIRLISLLALTLLDLNLPDRTLAVLENVAENQDPDIRRSICSIRARALLKIGEVERAQAEFRRGLSLDSEDLTPTADS